MSEPQPPLSLEEIAAAIDAKGADQFLRDVKHIGCDRTDKVRLLDRIADVYSPVSADVIEQRARDNGWVVGEHGEGSWSKTGQGCWKHHLRPMFANSTRCERCEMWIERGYAGMAPGLCFTCRFWSEKIGDDGIRVRDTTTGRVHYLSDGGRRNGKDKSCLGFGGAEFTINMFDGSVVSTNNMWSAGIVPVEFEAELYPNGHHAHVTPTSEDVEAWKAEQAMAALTQ